MKTHKKIPKDLASPMNAPRLKDEPIFNSNHASTAVSEMNQPFEEPFASPAAASLPQKTVHNQSLPETTIKTSARTHHLTPNHPLMKSLLLLGGSAIGILLILFGLFRTLRKQRGVMSRLLAHVFQIFKMAFTVNRV
jgi:hypothetical protein